MEDAPDGRRLVMMMHDDDDGGFYFIHLNNAVVSLFRLQHAAQGPLDFAETSAENPRQIMD